MKLTQPEIKIKCNIEHLNTLFKYLNEILNNYDLYKEGFICNHSGYELIKFNLQTLTEKTVKILFNNAGKKIKDLTIKINHAERMSLYAVTAYYPLPLDINFIEYNLNNGLLK